MVQVRTSGYFYSELAGGHVRAQIGASNIPIA